MNKLKETEKAVIQLKGCGLDAVEKYGRVYIQIGDIELELSEFEVNFRAELYDKEN